eukprot:COSAG02_NODE_2372_length_9029_cov_5.008735_1_plen_430_part_00
MGSHLHAPPNCVPAASDANPFDGLDGLPLTWSRALGGGTPLYRPGPLTPDQWRQWWEDGWTVVKAPQGAIDYAELHSKLAEVLEENAIRLSATGITSQGKSGDSWEDLLRRQGAIETAVPGNTAGDFSAQARALLHCDAMHRAVSHPSIIGMARQLTAAQDICLTGNYALRCKAPSLPLVSQGLPDGGTVPWHQDICCKHFHPPRVLCTGIAAGLNASLFSEHSLLTNHFPTFPSDVNPDAQDTIAVTFWMPLCDSTAENGTMQYIRGGHIGAHQDPTLRCSINAVDEGRTLEHVREPGYGVEGAPPTTGYMLIAEDNLPRGEAATVAVTEGELIVTSNLIPHRSLSNSSESIRISVDWRLQDVRCPHGWAQQSGSTAGREEAGGCWQISKQDEPEWQPDWQLLPGPDAAKTPLHPWSWIDVEGGFHRH